jgi:hypothetical protein
LAPVATNERDILKVASSGYSRDRVGKDVVCLVAKGGQASVNKGAGENRAITLMTVAGGKPPAHVTINEMTTVASVWTNNQFLQGGAIRSYTLGLRIAAQPRRRPHENGLTPHLLASHSLGFAAAKFGRVSKGHKIRSVVSETKMVNFLMRKSSNSSKQLFTAFAAL